MKSGQNKIKNFIDDIFAKHDEKEKNSKKSEYITAVIVNVILLYIFNNLLNWHVYFYRNPSKFEEFWGTENLVFCKL